MISEMNLQDLEEIKDCLLTDFDDFWSYNILKQELENGKSKYFVLKQENEIVGFAGILLIIDEVNIMNIVVRKDKRKLGIGSLLLEKIIDFSKIHNATSITLEVNEKTYLLLSYTKNMVLNRLVLEKNIIIMKITLF